MALMTTPCIGGHKKSKVIDTRFNSNFQMILDETVATREMMADLITLNGNSEPPMGLRRIIQDSVKCSICHSVPIKAPVIVGKCCKTCLAANSVQTHGILVPT